MDTGISLGWNCSSASYDVNNGYRKCKNDGYKTCPFDIDRKSACRERV